MRGAAHGECPPWRVHPGPRTRPRLPPWAGAMRREPVVRHRPVSHASHHEVYEAALANWRTHERFRARRDAARAAHGPACEEHERRLALLEAEERDVARLEGFTLAGLMARLTGAGAANLARERGEVLEARLRVDEQRAKLAALEAERATCAEGMAALADAEAIYQRAVDRMLGWMSNTAPEAFARAEPLQAQLEAATATAQAIALALEAGAGAREHLEDDAEQQHRVYLAAVFAWFFIMRVSELVLEAPKDEHELAGVLAHEMAHVLRKHHLKEIMRQAQSELLGDVAQTALSIFTNNSSDAQLIGALGRQVFNVGMQLYAQGLSREDELDADAHGAVIAARAGYDPAGLATLLFTLEAVDASNKEYELMSSTHPPTRERIQFLEKMLEKGLDRYEGTLSDNLRFVQMQERLARY